MRELAADESVSEEARESAKKAFEVLMSSQLLDIEQAAALKKIESEANFERKTAMHKLDSATPGWSALLASMPPAQQSAAQGVGEEMMDWLGLHRLQNFAANIAFVAGPCA